MAKILALDTSTDACSVALACDGEIMEDFRILPREHTRHLLPMVDKVLSTHQLTLNQLDAIAFGRGPGSFTGLRICLGVVQGLAFGANLPVLPVSTLAAMAAGVFRNEAELADRYLLVALDARMDEVYWSLFKRGDDDQLVEPLLDEFVMAPELVRNELIKGKVVENLSSGENIVGIGSGWHYSSLLEPSLGDVTVGSIDQSCHPHAYDIAALANHAFANGESINVFDAQPVYLRDRLSWKKRQRIRSGKPNND